MRSKPEADFYIWSHFTHLCNYFDQKQHLNGNQDWGGKGSEKRDPKMICGEGRLKVPALQHLFKGPLGIWGCRELASPGPCSTAGDTGNDPPILVTHK